MSRAERPDDMIPYGRQEISQADIDAVVDCLRSDFLTQGPAVPAFERRVADIVGSPHAIAVNSATSALHIACLALGVGPRDLVWTSPITFVASANAALYCGAEVDFVDIEPDTFNMDPAALEAKLVAAERAGRLPKVVIPVHMGGQSCRMDRIADLAKRYGFKVIEDASHAIGGRYRDDRIGACTYSDITVFSFHPVKIITTAEGGLATTRDPALAERMGLLRSHGVTRDPTLLHNPPDGPWYYEQVTLGFNYRITDLQAALGLSQCDRLDAFVDRRRQLADRYDAALSALPLALPGRDPDARSAWHLYIVRIDPKRHDHRASFERLRGAGLGVNLHYMPVYLQPHYRSLGFAPGLCPEAEAYYARAISIPLYAGLSDRDQDRVVRTLTTVLT